MAPVLSEAQVKLGHQRLIQRYFADLSKAERQSQAAISSAEVSGVAPHGDV